MNFDRMHTTGCDHTTNLRPEFRGCGKHLDAPQFLPRGASDDGMSIPLIARHDDVWDGAY